MRSASGFCSHKTKAIVVLLICVALCAAAYLCVWAARHLVLEGPLYSEQSGFYDEGFELKLHTLPGVRVYYTLDGSEPTENSAEYHGPIRIDDATGRENLYAAMTGMSGTYGDYIPDFPVDKATVVKSIAVFGRYRSPVSVGVYFVGFGDKSGYDGVRIMSMIVDPDDLFSDSGIYVVGTLAGKPDATAEYTPGTYPANYNIETADMRRKAKITLWDADKSLLADETLAVGIHGGWSKSFRQKGFNFYSVKEYGPDAYGLGEYMLRTSGFRDTFQTMFRDVFNQELVATRDIATQSSSPCVLFINGEYWGLYNLQQRYNETYFKNRYGIEKDDVIVIKSGYVAQGKESDIEYYNALIDYAATHDLSVTENYDTICGMMDVQSFIDYNCAQCYIANMDWPINNDCCFRSRSANGGSPYADGKWRWALYDTDDSDNVDITFPVMGRTASNPFTEEAHWAGDPAETALMAALRKNAEFCRLFAKTFAEMANTNFRYETVKPLLDRYASTYRAPMVMTQRRFQTAAFTAGTFDAYVANIDEFFKNRGAYVVPYMEEVFGHGD